MFGGAYRSDIVLILILAITMSTTPSSISISCEDARMRCAYRIGCGMALQHYLVACASTLEGDNCPESCQHALIALTSTDEGKELMTCECARNDTMCHEEKQRAEICRPSVTTVMNRTRISCRIATWICNADASCSTALQYYNGLCKSMFQGKKCTSRCINSISILTRQEKAAKLNTCLCEGRDKYECLMIHRNMNVLCFGERHHDYHEVKKIMGDTRTNEIHRSDRGNAVRHLIDRTTLLVSIVLLFFVMKQD